MTGMRIAPIAAVLGFALQGCGETPALEGFARRDSAGVNLIETSGTGSWSAGTAWTVADDLAIGETEGDDRFTFGRVGDVAPGPDGAIYVLDQQAQRVTVFDAAGGFVRTQGGPGEGPGELSRFANAVMVTGQDTAFVPDYAQARINVYGPDGSPAHTISIPARPSGHSWARRPDGSFYLRGVTISRDDAGRFQTWDGLLHLAADGAMLDTVIAFDYPHTELGTRENLQIPLIVNSAFWSVRGDGRIAWSSLDRDAVTIHRADGTRETILRHADWNARPVTPAEHEAMVELLREKLQMLGGDVSAADGPNVVAPQVFPAITGIRGGPDNTLWVQRMGDITAVDPMSINATDRSDWLGGPEWDVFDGDGRHLGTIVLPHRMRITHITDTHVYGVRKDAMDVERVVRLVLQRP